MVSPLWSLLGELVATDTLRLAVNESGVQVPPSRRPRPKHRRPDIAALTGVMPWLFRHGC